MSAKQRAERVEAANSRLVEKLNEAEARLQMTRSVVEEIYSRHRPLNPMNYASMSLGNFSRLEMYCEECLRPWPCRAWHDCRDIHGATYGREEPTTRYKTPKLEPIKEADND